MSNIRFAKCRLIAFFFSIRKTNIEIQLYCGIPFLKTIINAFEIITVWLIFLVYILQSQTQNARQNKFNTFANEYHLTENVNGKICLICNFNLNFDDNQMKCKKLAQKIMLTYNRISIFANFEKQT